MKVLEPGHRIWTLALWVILLVGSTIALLTGDLLPLPFLNEATLFIGVLVIGLVFVFLLWPLILPRLLEGTEGTTGSIVVLLVQMLLMFLLALPVLVACRFVSAVPMDEFLVGSGLLFASAIFVGALHLLCRSFHLNLHPTYYLLFFLTQALLPYFAYLSYELRQVETAPFARAFSPLWAVLELSESRAAAAQAIVLGSLSAGLLLWTHRRGRS